MKKLLSLVLALLLALSFAGCSGSTAMTEKNVTATVDQAFSALKDFNTKKLRKYVKSRTLSIICNYADSHDQFADLGKAMFQNLEYSIEQIDLEAKTVTVSVRNKDLTDTAASFAKTLAGKYSALQMLSLLSNEEWLNTSLNSLTGGIAQAKMQSTPVTVTLSINVGKKNLVIGFDNTAENAVSGGALLAVQSLFSLALQSATSSRHMAVWAMVCGGQPGAPGRYRSIKSRMAWGFSSSVSGATVALPITQPYRVVMPCPGSCTTRWPQSIWKEQAPFCRSSSALRPSAAPCR